MHRRDRICILCPTINVGLVRDDNQGKSGSSQPCARFNNPGQQHELLEIRGRVGSTIANNGLV
jgi:hypothetical protein